MKRCKIVKQTTDSSFLSSSCQNEVITDTDDKNEVMQIEIEEKLVIQGRTLVLSCHEKGIATKLNPSYQWKMNNKRSIPMSTFQDNGSIIIIENINARHSGVYKCTDGHNRIVSVTSVTVVGKY